VLKKRPPIERPHCALIGADDEHLVAVVLAKAGRDIHEGERVARLHLVLSLHGACIHAIVLARRRPATFSPARNTAAAGLPRPLAAPLASEAAGVAAAAHAASLDQGDDARRQRATRARSRAHPATMSPLPLPPAPARNTPMTTTRTVPEAATPLRAMPRATATAWMRAMASKAKAARAPLSIRAGRPPQGARSSDTRVTRGLRGVAPFRRSYGASIGVSSGWCRGKWRKGASSEALLEHAPLTRTRSHLSHGVPSRFLSFASFRLPPHFHPTSVTAPSPLWWRYSASSLLFQRHQQDLLRLAISPHVFHRRAALKACLSALPLPTPHPSHVSHFSFWYPPLPTSALPSLPFDPHPPRPCALAPVAACPDGSSACWLKRAHRTQDS